MKVTVAGHRGTTLLRITITGRLILDPGLSVRYWRRIADAAAGRVLALDLSGVTQVDAAGLGTLVMLAVEVRRHQGRLRLMCATPRVRTLVRTTGLGAALGLVSERAIARAIRRRDVIGSGDQRHLPEPAACRS